MSVAAASAPITVEQYLSFKGHPSLRDELIAGEIVLSCRPKPRHQQISENLHRLLSGALTNTGYVAKQNSNLRFEKANSMPAPDVFVVSRTAWTRACLEDRYVDEVPLLVVEVLSPANRRHRISRKVVLYRSEGVPAIWIVEPKTESVLVYQSNPDPIRHTSGLLDLPVQTAGPVSLSDIFILQR